MFARIIAAAFAACFASTAPAQSYPSRPVRLVVPYPPGGGTDIIGRVVAQKIGDALGQQVVVDNRGGAGGVIGTEIVAHAAPDGYTLLMAPTSHVINPSIYSKLSYDTEKDFAPITLAASATIVLAAHPSVAAKTLKELIALARAKPGELTFGSAGNGTVFHLAGELFKRQAGIQMTHVPFKGGGPTVAALAGGQISAAFETMLALSPHIKAGRARALAITSARRSSVMPDVPTTVELGFPGIVAENWYGFYAPRGTPKAIVARVNAEILKALKQPEVKERFQGLGTEVIGTSPEQLGEFVHKELAKWSRTAKEAGAHVE
ncbi:MAG TPA: tripartite tricarboxylate transporter substrate binding protein [Burkholderiales bacterium]|nr:tripartite tricarboxylate transporter substrate binding protein [Burkholderiales bacterium]